MTFDAKLREGCNRRECSCYFFFEEKCTLVSFPIYVIGYSLPETVKIENTKI